MERESESREGLCPKSVNALKAFVHSSNNFYNTIITFASHYNIGICCSCRMKTQGQIVVVFSSSYLATCGWREGRGKLSPYLTYSCLSGLSSMESDQYYFVFSSSFNISTLSPTIRSPPWFGGFLHSYLSPEILPDCIKLWQKIFHCVLP